MKKIEKHHFIFYISTIAVFFLIEKLFVNQVKELTSNIIGIIFYMLLLTFLTSSVFITLYGWVAITFLGWNYKTENPISGDELLLTIPVIITSFIVDDLFNLLGNYTMEYSIILTIILIPFIYLLIYKLNEWVLANVLI